MCFLVEHRANATVAQGTPFWVSPHFFPRNFLPCCSRQSFPQEHSHRTEQHSVRHPASSRWTGSVAQVSQDKRSPGIPPREHTSTPGSPTPSVLSLPSPCTPETSHRTVGYRRTPSSSRQFLEQSGGTYPAGQDTECSLMDVHDGIVLPFVAIYFLRESTRHN